MTHDIRAAERATRFVALRVAPALVAVRDVVARRHHHAPLGRHANQTELFVRQRLHFVVQIVALRLQLLIQFVLDRSVVLQ